MAREVLNYQSPVRRERVDWFSRDLGWIGYAAAGGMLGQPYVYQPPSDAKRRQFHVLSFGPDRHLGGGNDISH
jgi:hypothetical protein